jgi:ATP-dependent DNA helicase RecG
MQLNNMLNLETKIEEINKVGKTTAKRLDKIGIKTVYDLLFYFPFRYEDFTETKKINSLIPNEKSNIIGEIEYIQNKKSPKKRMSITEALINDGSESIKAIWFNQPFIIKTLKIGDKVSLSGKIMEDYSGYTLKSPVYEKIYSSDSSIKTIHTKGLIPNYHLTANITQKQIRFIINQILNLSEELKDYLPKEILKTEKLLSISEAIKKIHFPKNFKDIEEAKKRLSFNELFLIQLQSLIIKRENNKLKAFKILFKEKETKNFVKSLSFSLTDDQKKASWKILRDIEKEKPMARLLEGDVGSGKTIVALISLLNTALNKYQGAIMVPTEILAEQHFNSIVNFLKNFNITISLLTRSNKKTALKGKILNQKQFNIDNSGIIIGTHSLIQEKINFKNLALAIIDEQHRFGVEQRKKLIEKINQGKKEQYSPHLLSMTATPIPRSLALALYGDLNISIIDEMPKNRKKIITRLVEENNREKAYDFIRDEIKKGGQAFLICPLIDISDKLGVKSVKEEYEKLTKIVFPDLKIGMLHGKLKPKEKTEIMENFLKNKIKILISTSVVEVGMDVKNASIMAIEGAERFGLAQLHQFRGRVGRGERQSYCFLFSESSSEETKKRMEALVKYEKGLELAKIDLELRGAGEVYGTAQKGFPDLKIASLFDYALMKKARYYSENLLKKDPDLKNFPDLKDIIDKKNKNIHLE